MKPRTALLAAATLFVVPAFAAASAQYNPPPSNPPATPLPAPSATQGTKAPDTTCDTTAAKSDNAKSSRSDRGNASADTKPESVKSVTRDTGEMSARHQKKTDSEMACADQPQQPQ